MFGFNADDLSKNRAGGLSEVQKRRLRRRRSNDVLWSVLLTVMFSIPAAIFGYLAFSATPSPDLTWLITGLIIVAIEISFIVSAITKWRIFTADIVSGTVNVARGPATIQRQYSGRSIYYTVGIQSASLVIPNRAAKAFDPKTNYTAYFTPKAEMLLAIEE